MLDILSIRLYFCVAKSKDWLPMITLPLTIDTRFPVLLNSFNVLGFLGSNMYKN